ncbi:MAG: methyltransferase domain-containing protein [Dolichospermum circinale Clear-D4]|nr:methyltransferase domain-containing protein [Dolichospermum circinale Clear-D4]
MSNGNLKLINLDNYKIPFQDNYFDIIYADQVLEHVQDLNSLSELYNAFSQKFSSVKYREDLLLDSFSRKSAKLISSIPFGIKIFGLIWSHLLIDQKSS